jgi:hypothetical protein
MAQVSCGFVVNALAATEDRNPKEHEEKTGNTRKSLALG